MLVLRGGTVIDADGAREADVAVEGGRIEAVGDAPDGGDGIDATGRFVAPGLIDSHVHLTFDGRPDTPTHAEGSTAAASLRAAANLRSTLAGGVTAVRDLGSPGGVAIDARDAADADVVEGPRVRAAGENITMTGGHGHWLGREADGPGEVRKAAREQLKRGADVVKCMATGGVLTPGARTGAPELAPEELDALVGVADAAGVPAAAHAHGVEGIRNAVRAGVTSVEHGTFMDRETAGMMADRGVYWVPTAAALHGIVEHGTAGGIPAEAVGKAEDAAGAFADAFDHALDAGVPVAMGTDAGTPFNHHGESAAREMGLMVEYGLDPAGALEAATVGAADLLGLDDAGRVSPGHRADLVVLDANPLEDASAWHDPDVVVAGGTVVG